MTKNQVQKAQLYFFCTSLTLFSISLGTIIFGEPRLALGMISSALVFFYFFVKVEGFYIPPNLEDQD